ncbi:uncharacterized aarF domain-containing protein kinase 2-like [Prorops nasuta]|uniref:uncharacterized aarF domain-containing protein kinase 2-like n=1 Tax=Prorops nasuta TaxID=863751 RepID=UPI0034CD8396
MAQVAPLLRARFHATKTRGGIFKSSKLITLLSASGVAPKINSETKTTKIREKKSHFWALQETVFYFLRISIILSVAAFLIAIYLFTRLTDPDVFPTILLKAIEFLGPTFIKFGQWISVKKDIFPLEICNTLSQLQNNVSNHSWEYTKCLLKTTYGPDWQRLFAKFDKFPIGSGCCAQVYKAWIDLTALTQIRRDPRSPSIIGSNNIFYIIILVCAADLADRICYSNQEFCCENKSTRDLRTVAVKVLHPGIIEKIRRDLTIIRIICQCTTLLAPKLHWLSLNECVDEFSKIMENQVNLHLEATNLTKFAMNFSNMSDIIFPSPYLELTNDEILVESFHEGVPISDYINHDNSKLQHKLAKMGIQMILKMVDQACKCSSFPLSSIISLLIFQIFTDNFIHCDLHPGNILVQEGRKSKLGFFTSICKVVSSADCTENETRLVILDCGLVVSLNERCRENLQDVFRSVLMGDGELAAEYILHHSSELSTDPNGFKKTLGNIVRFHFRNRLNLNNVSSPFHSEWMSLWRPPDESTLKLAEFSSTVDATNGFAGERKYRCD